MNAPRILLFALLALAMQSAATGQLQWVKNPVNGHLYALTQGTKALAGMTALEAEARSHGGHLVAFDSLDEENFVRSAFPGEPEFWIGLVPLDQTFVWSTGEPLTYINFRLYFVSGLYRSTTRGWYPGVRDRFTRTRGVIEWTPFAGEYTPYRASCSGSAGIPILSSLTQKKTGQSLPSVGETLHLQVTGLAALTPGVLLLGLGDTTWNSLQLPLDLGVIGAPGCMLNVAPLISFSASSDAAGVALSDIAIPADPAHLGLTFFNQYVSMEAPPGRAMQITTTNAARGIIGI